MILLLACAEPGDAQLYAQAREAATFEVAWPLCERVEAPATRTDCQQDAAVRFRRFDACDALAEGVWREECWFAAAEHRAQAKAWAEALTACRSTSFVRNCETHVLDSFAMDHHARTVAEAAAAVAPLVPLLDIEHVSHEFWYAYFRIRIDAGLAVDVTGCPDDFCEGGARRAVMRRVDRDRKRSEEPTPPAYPWATTDWARHAVVTAWNRPPDRRPAGPLPSRAPVEPPVEME